MDFKEGGFGALTALPRDTFGGNGGSYRSFPGVRPEEVFDSLERTRHRALRVHRWLLDSIFSALEPMLRLTQRWTHYSTSAPRLQPFSRLYRLLSRRESKKGLRWSGSCVKNGSGLGIVVFINDNHPSPLI